MENFIIYELYYFLKIYIFENLLILNDYYYKYIANITFKQFSNDLLHYGFTILLKICAKETNEMIPF